MVWWMVNAGLRLYGGVNGSAWAVPRWRGGVVEAVMSGAATARYGYGGEFCCATVGGKVRLNKQMVTFSDDGDENRAQMARPKPKYGLL